MSLAHSFEREYHEGASPRWAQCSNRCLGMSPPFSTRCNGGLIAQQKTVLRFNVTPLFVLFNVLEGGVTRSFALDFHGKSLSSVLRIWNWKRMLLMFKAEHRSIVNTASTAGLGS